MDSRHARTISRSMYEAKTSAHRLSLEALDEDGVFAGYASVFGVVDSQQDMIERGAFSATLKQRAGEVKLLWQHDMREPIGIIEALHEDGNGLYIKARLLLEVARAREAYSLLKRGVVKGLSIGYTPRRYRIDPVSGVRTISDVALWEISLVTFPANEAAQVTVVKSAATSPAPHDAHAMHRLSTALDHALAALTH